MRGAFAEAVESVLPPRELGQAHGAAVVADHGDGTVDLLVDHEGIREARRTPVRVGLPGVRLALAVAEGRRVRLGFEGGQAESRYAASFDQDPAAGRGIAREDDPVDCGTITLRNPPPPATGIIIEYTPPGASAPAVVGAIAGAVSIAPDPLELHVVGVIDGGSEEVKLR